jgi:UDP-3-O-[3-hydroxymyristoyl] glucosamine N-acyltransferase
MKRFRVSLPVSKESLGMPLEVRFPAMLDSVGDLSEATPTMLCFLENPKYFHPEIDIHAGLLIVSNSFKGNDFPHANVIWSDHPYMLFVMLLRRWMQAEEAAVPSGIAPNASVHPSAKIGEHVRIGDFVVIGEDCVVGDHTVIESHCVLMDNSHVGQNCHLFPRVTIYPDTVCGNRVILHSGVVLGADGFGYVTYEGRQEKVPQLGNVVIDDDVEIGANTCVDRSTLQTTRVGRGTKLDNLVQVGHNCVLGQHSVLCSQVGLAGGTIVGNGVFIGGQTGTAGHQTIGDGTMVGAQSGVAGDIPPGSQILGTPAVDGSLQKRIYIALRKLPELLPAIRQIIQKGEEK